MRLFTYVLSLVVAGILIASPVGLFAQNKKYTLTGVVLDSATKKPVAKALVTIAGTKYEDSSKTDGNYKIDNLIPGTNNLIVHAAGYDTSIIKFEIRKNMKLDVVLVPQPKDTTRPAPASDTVRAKKKDSLPAPKQPEAKQKTKKTKTGITDKDKEQMRLLIEDAIFSKSIYFEEFKDKRHSVIVEGSFSIDTGFLYEFEAKFAKKPDGLELSWLNFKMKGRYAQ
jgi:hypothetical protein